MNELFWSGWQDSNLRPPAPKAGAMTGLRYTPKNSVRKYNTYPLSDKYFSVISGSFFKDVSPLVIEWVSCQKFLFEAHLRQCSAQNQLRRPKL
jgi:hypothetical protein